MMMHCWRGFLSFILVCSCVAVVCSIKRLILILYYVFTACSIRVLLFSRAHCAERRFDFKLMARKCDRICRFRLTASATLFLPLLLA